MPHHSQPGPPLLRYRLALRDSDGAAGGWRAGRRPSARFDYVKQARTLTVAPAAGANRQPGRDVGGAQEVPTREQIDGIGSIRNLSMREQRIAKVAWLTWFQHPAGPGSAGARRCAPAPEMLDLRPDAIDLDKDRYQAKLKKWKGTGNNFPIHHDRSSCPAEPRVTVEQIRSVTSDGTELGLCRLTANSSHPSGRHRPSRGPAPARSHGLGRHVRAPRDPQPRGRPAQRVGYEPWLAGLAGQLPPAAQRGPRPIHVRRCGAL
ncbi:hypothetical protein LV779_15015 [Streptomyces thinghirensis]|nr:hypothetical protein [Streptomyces thinghirensis]